MLSAGIGIFAALAFVLGLIALAVWALKRVGGTTMSNRTRLPVEVVQRVSLGPKSGLAIVRVGEKVMAVSMGDGGVHTLFEVDEADRLRIVAGSDVATPLVSSAAAREAFAGTKKAVLRPFGLALSDALDSTSSKQKKTTVETSANKIEPFAPEPRKTVTRQPRDLAAVLSMTLAPSTRLLSVAAVLCAGLLGPIQTTHAQGAEPARTGAGAGTGATATEPVAATQAAAAQAANAQAATAQATSAPTALNGQPPVAPPPVPPVTPPTVPQGITSSAPPPATQQSVRQNGVATVDPSDVASLGEAVGGLVPQLDLRLGSGPDSELRLNGTVGVVLMMGLMTMVPTLILMMTGFTRILIVLHFLKQAMGTQSAPPAHLVAALALLLTGFVMAPTISEANRTAVTPWLEGRIEQTEMLKTGVVPFREFMLRQTNEKDLRTFVEMSQIAQPDTPDDVPLHVLMSAFVASELRTAFQIGFAIYLPFIIIDAVVASVLMAMGMFMLPPAMISLPFKLLLFVLVDGWSLTIQSLVQSFR